MGVDDGLEGDELKTDKRGSDQRWGTIVGDYERTEENCGLVAMPLDGLREPAQRRGGYKDSVEGRKRGRWGGER